MANIETAGKFTLMLEANGFEPWIDHGTLLGIIRDGKLIDGDKDFDIGMWRPNRREFLKVYRLLQEGCVGLNNCLGVVYDPFIKGFKIQFSDPNQDIRWSIDIQFYESDGQLAVKEYPDFRHFNRNQFFALRLLYEMQNQSRYLVGSNWLKSFSWLAIKLLWKIIGKLLSLSLQIRILDAVSPSKVPFVKTAVERHFFLEFRQINPSECKLRVPADAKGYLEARYGDSWSIPDPHWNYLVDDRSILPQ